MASLSNVLASIPGMAGYYAKDQLNREQTAGDLQQIGALSNLQAQLAARQRQEAARQALAGLGPDATEDQRVQALLPHIGDPDKIAGILQNASLRKAQQEQTKQIAMTRLQQQASQHLDNLAVKIQNARTAEERSHWEQQVAQAQLGFRQQAADIAAGRFNYETGMTVPPLPRPFIQGAAGASAAQVAPTPQPAPSAAPRPVSAPSVAPVVPSGPAPMGRQGPMDGKVGQLRILDGELAQLDQMIREAKTPDEKAQFEANRASVQRERDAAAAGIPAAPNNLDARDLKLAQMPNGGLPASPQAAPAAVPAPTAAPQAAPQPAPQPTASPIVMPPEIARLPKKAQDAWMADQIKKQGDSKNRVLDEKAIEDERKRGLRLTLQNERANLVLRAVDDALDKIGFANTGLIGGVTKFIPSTPAYNLDKAVDTVKANIGFQELQAMREASPTGGALGQVAVQELNMLQSVLGSLDVGQSSDQLRKNLGAVKTHYENWKKIMQQAEASRIPKVGAVVDGFRFRGGDPSKSTSWEPLK